MRNIFNGNLYIYVHYLQSYFSMLLFALHGKIKNSKTPNIMAVVDRSSVQLPSNHLPNLISNVH